MRIILNKPLTLSKIKSALSSEASACDEVVIIKAISTDSRLCQPGDLFVAIKGENQSGEDFIKDAKEKGAYTLSSECDSADIKVSDTRDSLIAIAEAYKSQFKLRETVVITGSVGKTTTKNISKTLLGEKFKIHATSGNLNNELGVPYTILSMKEDTEILIIEAGMNHSGELKRLSRCIGPTLAVITNIGSAHIGNLGSRENIASAKMEILDANMQAFTLIPANEPLLSGIINKATVSTSLSDADFFLKTEESEPETLKFSYFSPGFTFQSEKISVGGLYFKECLAFAIAIAISIGFSSKEISSGIRAYAASSSTNKESVGSITVIDDCYNASPESVKLALKSLSLGTNPSYSALLGDMLELGDYSERYHYLIGKYAAEYGLKKLYLIGEHAEHIKFGAMAAGMNKESIFYNPDSESPEVTAKEIYRHSRGETVLFKASRGMRLERVKVLLKEYFKEE